MNYFKKTGLCLLIIALFTSLLAGCGSDKNENPTTDNGLYTKEELVKYNDYVKLSNAINYDFVTARANYFKSYSADNREFNTPSNNDILTPIRNPAETTNALMAMKDSVSKTPSLPMDKDFKKLSGEITNEIHILNELQTYFTAKSYLDDNFAKAAKLHKELTKSIQNSNKEIQSFNEEMQKLNATQQAFAAKEMEKSGSLTCLALNNFISASENLIAELRNQQIDATNVTELDIAAYEKQYSHLTKTYEAFIKASTDETQLEKEKLTSNDLVFLVKKVTSTKAEATLLIDRAKKKQVIPEDELKNPIFIETMEGTPEKLLKEYNDLISDYNTSLSFHKKYPRRINSVGIIFIY